ncbi:MAG: cytochrome c [Chromatiales bacterium]|nr:cytochrome c [Gammaproteobacteria bacterium]MBW6475833.1 cytochrome c [Chromatiales bacterium]
MTPLSKKILGMAILSLISLGLLAACGESPEATAQERATETTSAESMPQTPVRSSDFRIPPQGFVTDLQRGQQLFVANCAQCHGTDARGSDKGPPLIHRIYEPSHHSDLAFYFAVSRGTHQHHWNFGNMPPVPGVNGEDAAHIIAWVRQQQRAAGIH